MAFSCSREFDIYEEPSAHACLCAGKTCGHPSRHNYSSSVRSGHTTAMLPHASPWLSPLVSCSPLRHPQALKTLSGYCRATAPGHKCAVNGRSAHKDHSPAATSGRGASTGRRTAQPGGSTAALLTPWGSHPPLLRPDPGRSSGRGRGGLRGRPPPGCRGGAARRPGWRRRLLHLHTIAGADIQQQL
jgi:hypothetical protein